MDIGGTIVDPPAEDLGQGTETYPIDDPRPLVNYNSARSWGVRTLKAFLILLALQHNVQQVVEVSTETSSGPPSHSVEVEDPDPPAVPPAP